MKSADQLILIKIKSLLNHLRYFIKDEVLPLVDEFHNVCRRECSWGEKALPTKGRKEG